MPPLVLIIHNIRSTHNVGAILRTAEGFGVSHCYFTGYTPYPSMPGDSRLPHLAAKIDKSIAKTALGAQELVPFSVHADVAQCIEQLKDQGYRIVGLEQDSRSINLENYRRDQPTALLLGEEVSGITPELRGLCDDLIEIPMSGKKESFNVSVAAGIAMYELTRMRDNG